MSWGKVLVEWGTTVGCPPNDNGVISGLGTTADIARATNAAVRCDDRGLSPIHSTYYDYYFL